MLTMAIPIAFTMISLALLLNLWRLVQGPTLPDRIVALDTLYINTVALLILFGIHLNSTLYFEAALVIALMGFISTISLCKYMLRGDIIE